ncbi:MAG: histidine kinase [Opitutaceae bacterium]
MRRALLLPLFWRWVFCAAVWTANAAEPETRNFADRTWKPMADWYRPDLRITKLTPRTIEQSELRIQMGDDPRWAAPDWDDRTWTPVERTRVPSKKGIFWLRLRVRSTGRDEPIPGLLMIRGGLSAWECYWDGVAAGSWGTPGNSVAAEREKGATTLIELPSSMTVSGEHVVALRVSTYHSPQEAGGYAPLLFWTTPPEAYEALGATLRLFPAMGVGAMLTIGIAVLVMWMVADRRLILALFSALCLSAAVLVAVASAPMMWDYPASWRSIQIALRIGLVVAVSSLLLATVLAHSYPTWRRRWLALPLLAETALALCYPPVGVNALTPVLWRVAFVWALGFVSWAVWRRREGSWLVMTGLALTFALFERDPKHFEHSDFLVGFLPVLGGLIGAIALRLRSERLQARDTKLMAARLEIELLKKSLQPHFLMNTLTALSQVIEEKPAAAVQLIDDLASEFRSLARFSSEKQVSIAEELALCRAHLGVMSARTDLAWNLEAEGLDVSATVPPALFLTLIENGFTHQRARRDATTFVLRAERVGDGMRYTFLSPGTVTQETHRATGGTGLRYVCARLEESFHDAWKLSHGAVPGGWETVIELLHVRRHGASP